MLRFIFFVIGHLDLIPVAVPSWIFRLHIRDHQDYRNISMMILLGMKLNRKRNNAKCLLLNVVHSLFILQFLLYCLVTKCIIEGVKNLDTFNFEKVTVKTRMGLWSIAVLSTYLKVMFTAACASLFNILSTLRERLQK